MYKKKSKIDERSPDSQNVPKICPGYCSCMFVKEWSWRQVPFLKYISLLLYSCRKAVDKMQRKEGVKKRCHWESKMKNSAKEEEILVLVWFCCPFFHQKLFTTGPKLILQGIIISLFF